MACLGEALLDKSSVLTQIMKPEVFGLSRSNRQFAGCSLIQELRGIAYYD